MERNNNIAKIAIEESHFGGEFIVDDQYQTTNRTVEFQINPANAYDYNGNPIPFSTLKAAAEDCCDQWNQQTNIPNANITFSVSADSTTETFDSSDDVHLICFTPNGMGDYLALAIPHSVMSLI